MTDQFDGDIALIMGQDGGEIIYSGGQPVMDAGGLETAVNISLFSGLGWWGNGLFDSEPDRQIGSEFEEKLRPRAITNAYLIEVEEAAKNALKWMISQNISEENQISVSWPELNTVIIDILIIKKDGENVDLKYELSWENGLLSPVTAGVK